LPVNINPIVNFAKGCVEASPTDQELAQLSGAIQTIENNDATYAVACSALLPDVSENKGRWVYVTDTQKHLYSNGEEWEDMYNSTLVIKCNLFYWGSAYQPSNAASVARSSPVQEFTSGADWKTLAEGPKQPGAIKTDGTLWSWGSNQWGNLANNSSGVSDTMSSPVQEITSSTNWCYMNDLSAVKTDGTLWMWGCGSGELMVNVSISVCNSSPVQEYTSSTNWCYINRITGQKAVGIKTDGTLWLAGNDSSYGTMGVNTCGINYSSPVQEITSSTNWKKSKFASNFSVQALKTDGTLWAWGTPFCGTIGRSGENRSSPIQENCSFTNWCEIGSGSSMTTNGIRADGTMWSFGPDCAGGALALGFIPCFCRVYEACQEYCSATNWYKIGTAFDATGSAIKTDSTLWAWGCNCNGSQIPMNIGAYTCSLSPVQEISSVACWTQVSTKFWLGLGLQQKNTGFNEP